jgi:dihydropyrimidinase
LKPLETYKGENFHMTFDSLLKGGEVLVANEGLIKADIGIKNGKIAEIIYTERPIETKQVINVSGKVVIPGIIDAHTHLTMGDSPDPYMTETKTAALGGVTSILTYLFKSGDYQELYEDDYNQVMTRSFADVGFHLGLVSDLHKQEIPQYVKEYGVTSYKFFMNFRGEEGKYLGIKGIDDGLMYEFFQEIAKVPGGVIATHPENIEVIWKRNETLKKLGRDDLEAWTEARIDFVEAENILRALYFAKETGVTLYLPHVSSKKALEECQMFKKRYDNYFVETCPHYLIKTCKSSLGTLGKVNPPLRYEQDVEALWDGIKDGTIDVVGSDHVPRRRSHKEGGIWKASAGFQGLATLLPLMLDEGYHKRGVSLEKIVGILCENPARIFGLESKGFIKVGNDADFAVIDLNLEKEVSVQDLGSYCDYSIYEGMSLKGWPIMTILRGNIMMEDGEITADPGMGKYISRGKVGVYR